MIPSLPLLALLTLFVPVAVHAGGGWPSDLYAFDNGLTRTAPIDAKVRLLKDLGFAGVGGRPGKVAEWLEALDRHGIKMAGLYVTLKTESASLPLKAEFTSELARLQGRDTVVWLNLSGAKGASDEIAVNMIEAVSDEARKAGLRVALYPHAGCYTETVQDVIRLVDKVDRTDVGASFNLCHFLKTDDAANLEPVLRKVAPRLMLVTVNGADQGNTQAMNWDRLIQPLGRGTFETRRVLSLLGQLGYRGPVVLQSYNIPGDDRDNLRASMEVWTTWTGASE